MTTLTQLASRRFLLVTGKGGVGKSLVAASLGRLLAGRGRRVLVIEVDSRENVHRMLGIEPSGGQVAEVGGGLFLQNLKPRQALDELVRAQLGLDLLANRVLASDLYSQLSDGIPGFKEVAVLHTFRERGRRRGRDRVKPFDTVILDAPATGHGVSLLLAPRLLAEVIAEGPVGRTAAELAGFVADGRQLALVVVTQAEEMPVQESLELREKLAERLDREPELLVVNGLYPPLPASALEAVEAGSEEASAFASWHRRRTIQERELARLEEAWPGTRVELPQLALDSGPELVAALGEGLAQGLAEGPIP